jgi:threonine aldolase
MQTASENARLFLGEGNLMRLDREATGSDPYRRVNLFSDVATSYQPGTANAGRGRQATTIRDLEARAAEITAKESALFMPSGTMGNLVATLTHCRPGEQIIVGAKAHTVLYEGAGAARVGGVVWRVAKDDGGVIAPSMIEELYTGGSILAGPTKLLWIEDTFMFAGGVAIPISTLRETETLARSLRLSVHIDGARIFNAAVAQRVRVDEITRHADSIMFCLNKTLGAPMGALLCGATEFIEEARAHRQMLGGGAFHAPIGVDEAIEALRDFETPLKRDHRHARELAETLSGCRGLEINSPVDTNMVMIRLVHHDLSSEWLVSELGARGVLAWAMDTTTVRLATHRALSDEDVAYAKNVLADLRRLLESGLDMTTGSSGRQTAFMSGLPGPSTP